MATRRGTPKQSPWEGNLIGGVTFDIGDIDDDTVTVRVQLLSQGQGNLAQPGRVDWWVTTDADGLVLSTALHGAVEAGDEGTVRNTVTGIAGFAISNEDGEIDFALTHVGDRNVYLALGLPDGSVAVSDVIGFTETGTGS
jgi:hypothetical protein